MLFRSRRPSGPRKPGGDKRPPAGRRGAPPRGGKGDAPTLVEPVRTYNMRPGDAHLYDVGAVHSPKRAAPVKLVRIEGKNLDHVKRSNIKAR